MDTFDTEDGIGPLPFTHGWFRPTSTFDSDLVAEVPRSKEDRLDLTAEWIRDAIEEGTNPVWYVADRRGLWPRAVLKDVYLTMQSGRLGSDDRTQDLIRTSVKKAMQEMTNMVETLDSQLDR